MKKFIFLLVLLGLLELSLALFLTSWRNWFWDAVATKNLYEFQLQLGVFAVVALSLCFVSGMSTYIMRRCSIEWSKILVAKALPIMHTMTHDNIGQRIEADTSEYPDLALTLGFGVIRAIGYVVVFSIAIIYNFNYVYVLAIVLYTILGSLIIRHIARPLVGFNYQQQNLNATFRQTLLKDSFNKCIEMALGIAKRTKYLNYFQSFWSQLSVLLPLLLVAPAYFLGGMTFGQLMQLNSSCSTLLDNFLYPANSFATYNRLLSCRRRLKEINII